VTHSTRHTGASRRCGSLRALRGSVVFTAVVVALACGKKGPPLAPFARVPAQVTPVTTQRVGSDVYLSFPVPARNVDGGEPADIAALEVYAVTATRPPATEDQREVAELVATVAVRPVMPEIPVPADGTAPPPIPLPPGVDRGAMAVVREALTADALIPVELPEEEVVAAVDDRGVEVEPLPGPMVAPAATQLPRRHYFVIGVSPRGRKSDPSTPVSVPLDSASSAPGAPKVDYTETNITLTWEPSPDARTATVLAPIAPAAPAVSAAPASPPLNARSLGFNTEPTTYHVYEVPAAGETVAVADPYAIKLPAPITPAPLSTTRHVLAGVAFGAERCFEVRPVDRIFGTDVIGPPSPKTCVMFKDSFPPAAPKSLAVIPLSGVINLIWEASPEKDLAGYHVLRADAPGDTLRPITSEPVAAATYRDETVKPGTRYVYAVVAVDRAGNMSPQSNRQEETAK
jgi:predicted small lipoprotein YifL